MASLPYDNASSHRPIAAPRASSIRRISLNWRLLLAILLNCAAWVAIVKVSTSLF
jgi:hypothetical protein